MGEPSRGAEWSRPHGPSLVLGLLWGLGGCIETGMLPATDSAGAPEAATSWTDPDPTLRLVGGGDPRPQAPTAADPLFMEGVVHRIDLAFEPADRHALDSDPRTDVPATFAFGDERWNVGVQLKGSFSYRPLGQKASFKIDFEEFEEGRRFYGLQRITLNSMVQDASMIREHEAYWMYGRLGVPAPRHGFAEVWVDGEPYGLYGLLETIDGTWAERVYPDDAEGPIYEGGYGVDLEDGDANRFDLQRQGDLVEPWSDIAALIEELEATPPEDYLAWLELRFDTPALFRMMAMDLVLGHRDGYVKRKNNFLLYHGLRYDRWALIPWGQDQTFRGNMGVHGNYSGELAARCAESVPCQRRLDAAVTDVAAAWESLDLHGHAAATVALIEAACEEDPRKERPCSHSSVLEMIVERPDEVRADLAEE